MHSAHHDQERAAELQNEFFEAAGRMTSGRASKKCCWHGEWESTELHRPFLILDIGPEGGDQGGRIVGCGTPEQISELNNSYTGKHIKPLLDPKKLAAE